jgi:signal transduction histidine kinase
VWTLEEQSFATAIAGFASMSIETHERRKAEERIRQLNAGLEERVEERTKQLRYAQEELIRKEKLAILGQLSASVGHELRNPLGVISNAIYYLTTVRGCADETVREYLDIIKDEIANALRIISDLLDFSRTTPPQSTAVRVGELIHETLGRCQVPGDVRTVVELPDGLSAVMADPFQMGQVFQNIITNAVQAMSGSGTLRISARLVSPDAGTAPRGCPVEGEHAVSPLQKRNFVEISVNDTGDGISPANMSKLFLPLFTTKAKGIGLGLVVSKKLVEANGGRISVASEPGRGTTFTVTLPEAE